MVIFARRICSGSMEVEMVVVTQITNGPFAPVGILCINFKDAGVCDSSYIGDPDVCTMRAIMNLESVPQVLS